MTGGGARAAVRRGCGPGSPRCGRASPRRRGRRRRSPGGFRATAQLALSRRLGDVFGYDWAGGAARSRGASLVLGVGRRRADHHAGERGRSARVHLLHHPRGRPRGLRAGARPGAGAAAGRVAAPRWGCTRASRGCSRTSSGAAGRSAPGSGRRCARPSAISASDGPEALYRAVNAVETGFIRTEADEVHYNLHVMMRFDLERALIAGDLAVADLEAAWNARFAADFGRDGARRAARRAAGRALVGRALRLLPDLHARQHLCRRAPRRAAARRRRGRRAAGGGRAARRSSTGSARTSTAGAGCWPRGRWSPPPAAASRTRPRCSASSRRSTARFTG